MATLRFPYVALISTLLPSAATASWPAGRGRHQSEVEERLRRGFTNGPHQMAIERKLPARMHLFQFADDGVKLIDEHGGPRRPRSMVHGRVRGPAFTGSATAMMMPQVVVLRVPYQAAGALGSGILVRVTPPAVGYRQGSLSEPPVPSERPGGLQEGRM